MNKAKIDVGRLQKTPQQTSCLAEVREEGGGGVWKNLVPGQMWK